MRDSKLRVLVLDGVAFHHAGLDTQDRKLIEAAFTQGDLPVLSKAQIYLDNPTDPLFDYSLFHMCSVTSFLENFLNFPNM